MRNFESESPTLVLADFVARTTFEDLPREVVNETKRIILDSLGCGLGGTTVAKGKGATALAKELGGPAEASILGTRGRVSCANATFANAELINALEFDANLVPGHISPFVISAPLALAESRAGRGKDLVTAVALAHEVGARVGASMSGIRTEGGQPNSVVGFGCGAFGSAAGAAKIMGFSQDQIANVFGIAGVLAPVPSTGKFMHSRFVSTFKYAPAGWIAQGGLMGVLLTERGYMGEESILDGEHGFWRMHGSASYNPERMTKELGQDWLLLTTEYKRWPICGAFLSILDAFAEILAEHDLLPDEIESVIARGDPLNSLPVQANDAMRSNMDAQFRITYSIAVVAHRIEIGPAWQDDKIMWDERIQRFRQKVRFEVYPRCHEARNQDMAEGKPYVSRRPACVEVVARGKTFRAEVDYAKWTPVDAPGIRATNEDLEGKFRVNALCVLRKDRVEAAIEDIQNLEKSENVAELMKLLSPDGTSGFKG